MLKILRRMKQRYHASYLRSIALYNMAYKEQFIQIHKQLKEAAEIPEFELTLPYKLEKPVKDALEFYEYKVSESAGEEPETIVTIIRFI